MPFSSVNENVQNLQDDIHKIFNKLHNIYIYNDHLHMINKGIKIWKMNVEE